jgi:hypothetical protein
VWRRLVIGHRMTEARFAHRSLATGGRLLESLTRATADSPFRRHSTPLCRLLAPITTIAPRPASQSAQAVAAFVKYTSQPLAERYRVRMINKAAAALGRRGGKAGIGKAKRRGNSAHYKRLAALAAKARAAKRSKA